jgi:hypothetical protein
MHSTTIRNRRGLIVELLGRKNVTHVWARRDEDNALRVYANADLLHEGGAQPLMLAIQSLPLMRKAAAERARSESAMRRETAVCID